MGNCSSTQSTKVIYTLLCKSLRHISIYTHTCEKVLGQLFIYFAVVCQTQQEVSVYMSKHSFSPLIFAIH